MESNKVEMNGKAATSMELTAGNAPFLFPSQRWMHLHTNTHTHALVFPDLLKQDYILSGAQD